jgi:predicted TIM-barrel fold metal-dependent hydrolase
VDEAPALHYIAQHVRFVAHGLEGPEDPAEMEQWLRVSDGGRLLMYGSNYPQWNFLRPGLTFAGSADAMRARILRETAAELYGPRLQPAPQAGAEGAVS